MKQFETVLEVAACGSISKAAKKLKIAQPTLSKYLAAIEADLNTVLFDRTTIPIRLTAAGEKFVYSARQILDVYSRLERDILKLCNDSKKMLRIGISPTRAHYILSTVINEFRRVNSSTKVVVHERTMSQLNAELERGELDLIISLKHDGTKQFGSINLFFEEIMLAIPKKYKEFDIIRIFKECPFVSAGAGLRMSEVLLNILSEFGGKSPDIEVQSIESVISIVNQGMGVALVPSYVSTYGGYENTVFVELPEQVKKRFGKELIREVCVFYRQEESFTSAEEDFIAACRKIAGI